MIDRAINVAMLGLATLAIAPVVPMNRHLKRISYVIGVILLVAAAVMFFWPEPKAQPPKPVPLIKSAGDQILKNSLFENTGDRPLTESGGKLTAEGLTVRGHMEIPPPSGELTKWTNDEVVASANKLSKEISDYERANAKISTDIKQKYYTEHFDARVKTFAAELNDRILDGFKAPPRPDRYQVGQGRAVALSGMLVGPWPLFAVANFLLSAASQVPVVIRGQK